MITHTEITYETIDGRIFDSEEEAYNHELSIIYQRSGFRFFYEDGTPITDVSRCYDDSDYFTIDHSKDKENCEFVNMTGYYFGYEFPEGVLMNKSITKYKYDMRDWSWKPAYLVEEQKPVKPKKDCELNELNMTLDVYYCGNCGEKITGKGKFCSNCGREVKWE